MKKNRIIYIPAAEVFTVLMSDVELETLLIAVTEMKYRLSSSTGVEELFRSMFAVTLPAFIDPCRFRLEFVGH